MNSWLWGVGMAQWWHRSPPAMWPEFDSSPVPCVGWVSSRLASTPPRVFIRRGDRVFVISQKPATPKSRTRMKTSQAWCGFLSKYCDLFMMTHCWFHTCYVYTCFVFPSYNHWNLGDRNHRSGNQTCSARRKAAIPLSMVAPRCNTHDHRLHYSRCPMDRGIRIHCLGFRFMERACPPVTGLHFTRPIPPPAVV